MTGHDCPPESIRTSVRGRDLHKFQLIVLDSPWLGFGLNRRSTTEAVSFRTPVFAGLPAALLRPLAARRWNRDFQGAVDGLIRRAGSERADG